MAASVRQWLSAAELAGLPGVATTPRSVRRQASRLGWKTDVMIRNGGRTTVIAADTLPPETQAELARRAALSEHPAALSDAYKAGAALAEAMRPASQGTPAPSAAPADSRQSAIARARLEVLRHRDAFAAASGLSKSEAAVFFARAWSDGRIEADSEVRQLIPTVSATTLARWEASERSGGMAGLAPKYGATKGRSRIDEHPEVADAILGMMVQMPHVRAKHVHEMVSGRWPELMLSEPTVRRWMQAWQAAHPYEWAKIRNPDAAKSRYLPAFGSASDAITRPCQQWELDSSPADILLADGRHSLIAAVDVYTRRVRFVLAKSSTAAAVAAVVRKAILAWGVPETIRTDNGRDYTSTYLMEALRALEIEQVLCPPFSGDKKPHVERIFGTLQRDVIELLPGYCGHSVSERQAIEARRSKAQQIALGADNLIETTLTSDELRGILDKWVTAYEQRPHSGLGGLSPAEVARRYQGTIRRIEDVRALDMLLAEAPAGQRGDRTVKKSGLKVEGAWFIAGELGAFIERRVRVRLDPEDLGRIYVYSEDWKFICVAECAERTGISRAEVAAKAHARAKELDKEVAALRRRAKAAIRTEDIADAILDRRLSEQCQVVPIRPAPSETYTTPALEAASEAIAEAERKPAAYTQEESEAQAAFVARLEASRAEVDAKIRSEREERDALIADWCSLAERLTELSDDDRAWVEAIAATEPDVRLWVPEHRPDLAHLIPSPTARHLRLA